MEDGWETHVSPIMMGVGMDMAEMSQQQEQHHTGDMDIQPHHHHHQDMGGSHQGLGSSNSNSSRDMQHEQLEHEIDLRGHHQHHQQQHQHDGIGDGDYYGHQDSGYSFSNKELLVSGQPTTATTPGSPPVSGGGSLSPGGSAGMPGALSPGGTSSTGPPGSTTQCCESGRPLVTDPVTGQSVCSCQYDSARLAALQYRNAGVGVYGTPYPSTEQNPYPSIGVDSSAFYSPLSNPYALKDAGGAADMSAWTSAGLQPTTGYYPYDPTLAAYGYGAGYDLAARRKNATRESTATLKAWLNEHKKNPYPTKGEKIMLAIITKMTLTQVSTWFANARRRLKKENKMTWEPKNKTDDDDDALVSDSDDKDKDDDDKRDDTDIHGRIKTERNSLGKDLDIDDDMTADDDRKDDLLTNNMHHILGTTFSLKPELKNSDCGVPLPPSKPKIWSLADTAACKTPPPAPPGQQQCAAQGQQQHHLLNQHQQHQQQQHHQWMGGFALPTAARYAGMQGFPDVQTDTPPQTPPNMKLPSVAGNLPPCIGGGNNGGGGGGYGQAGGFLGGFGRLQSPHRQQPTSQQAQHGQQQMGGPGVVDNAAFKPFYKSSQSMNGGFVSPV